MNNKSEDSFFIIEGQASSGIFLCAEHSGREIPEKYNNLGIDPSHIEQETNLLYDHGVMEITRDVANATMATAILGRYSRLLVDLNRGAGQPHVMPETAHDLPIPGNCALSDQEKDHRLKNYYHPYHARFEAEINSFKHQGITPFVLSIHSYTPKVGARSCKSDIATMPDIDILFVDTNPVISAFQEFLTAQNIKFANNIPYSLRDYPECSLCQHVIPKSIPAMLIDISIDRLKTPEDIMFWSRLLINFCTAQQNQIHSVSDVA